MIKTCVTIFEILYSFIEIRIQKREKRYKKRKNPTEKPNSCTIDKKASLSGFNTVLSSFYMPGNSPRPTSFI